MGFSGWHECAGSAAPFLFKGNGQECPFHTCLASLRSLDSRGGCLYRVRRAAGEQQAPHALSRARNDRTWDGGSFKINIYVKGNGQECPFHTTFASLRSLDSRGGCFHLSRGATG